MGGDDLPLGGKSSKDKGPNLYKRAAADARKQPQINVQAQEDPLGEFGDGSKMTVDWRGGDLRVVGKVIKQRLEICWAIVMARLLQAIFNITDTNDYKEFLHDDLVVHLKSNQKSVKLQNLKDATDHIAKHGLLKAKASGHAKAGSSVGFHGKWEFLTEQSPSAEFIKSKVDISPVAISFAIGTTFHILEKGICKVEDLLSSQPLAEGYIEGHAVLIVGYGYANGQLFFLLQNSWGEDWGVKGYGRIFIDENSKTTVVYPMV